MNIIRLTRRGLPWCLLGLLLAGCASTGPTNNTGGTGVGDPGLFRHDHTTGDGGSVFYRIVPDN